MADRSQRRRRAVTILNVGAMHDETDHHTERVGRMLRLRLSIFLPASKPRTPPLSVALMLSLSVTPAAG